MLTAWAKRPADSTGGPQVPNDCFWADRLLFPEVLPSFQRDVCPRSEGGLPGLALPSGNKLHYFWVFISQRSLAQEKDRWPGVGTLELETWNLLLPGWVVLDKLFDSPDLNFLICNFFKKINFYWSIVALQCCVSFLLYSKVNQSYVYIYPLFFRFPSHLGHHRALSRVPCAIQ